jgi:hypothetical protein
LFLNLLVAWRLIVTHLSSALVKLLSLSALLFFLLLHCPSVRSIAHDYLSLVSTCLSNTLPSIGDIWPPKDKTGSCAPPSASTGSAKKTERRHNVAVHIAGMAVRFAAVPPITVVTLPISRL